MKEEKQIAELNKNDKVINYNLLGRYKLDFAIKGLTVDKGVKNWNFEGDEKTILGIFSNEEESLNNILQALAGISLVTDGQIILNNEEVTYNSVGWDRSIVYTDLTLQNWNKLFSIKFNLVSNALKNKSFLQEVSNRNLTIKAKINSLKTTKLSVDVENFKEELIILIKNFVDESIKNHNIFNKEYLEQINFFHKDFAKNKFNFAGSEILVPILIKKFNAEENNIVANNNLLFLQSLQDRIASLENLVGKCFCECAVSKSRIKEFELREIIPILKEINVYLNKKVYYARKEVRSTLKSCNNYNQIFNVEVNKAFSYKKIYITRSKVDQIIDQWIDLAEVKRIKFNMKQDFLAMQLLPDEMSLLLKKIKEKIAEYHKTLLQNPTFITQEEYNQKMEFYQNQLVSVKDLIVDNMLYILKILDLEHLWNKKYNSLSKIEKRIIIIVQKIIVVSKILIIENPFQLLEPEEKNTLAQWIKIIAKKLKIAVIFSFTSNEEIDLLATHISAIENQDVIEQGEVGAIEAKPLSLFLLKEIAKKHLNVIEDNVYKKDDNIYFYDNKLGHFPHSTSKPIIAFKSKDIEFTVKKPFLAFNKSFLIKGVVKNIKKISEEESMLTIETLNNILFEVVITNNNNYNVSDWGWVIFKKGSIYIFDKNTKILIGTW